MFSKILIANRGEIACRVMRTAKMMGVKTVAVFSEADANSLHVQDADEAYLLGPAPAAQSYLCGDKIIDIATACGAEAIHPGYGFLSENAGFARACAAAGIVFIGPRPETIDVMGSKSLAKDLMAKAGVPLSPGYQGEDQSVAVFKAEAARIGYPVLLKAAAGGGGKGMRIVDDEAGIEEALLSAKREAMSAFGDDRFLVEKFITGPRHVEVQVFGDRHGDVVHLYERDCSVQRRYQKVVEEAPAPHLPELVRARLLQAGVDAAKAVGYEGAGTVEFLYDGADQVYFMEMNTRLQVEHPVTEEVTGLDLVEWQLRVAAGEPLPLEQDQIYCDGHAVEVRLYAEDPDNDFMPSIGPIDHFTLPQGDGVRADSGIQAGQAVTPYYDPMIAKIITHGDDRRAALAALANAVQACDVTPLVTNQGFLHRILTNKVFMAGGVTTKFLEEYPDLAATPLPAAARIGLAGLLAYAAPTGGGAGPWRMNQPARLKISTLIAGEMVPVDLASEGPDWVGTVGDVDVRLDQVRLAADGQTASCLSAGVRHGIAARFDRCAGRLSGVIMGGEGGFAIAFPHPGDIAADASGDAASLVAPMPSTVTGVTVTAGAAVQKGAVLMTLEAMKMEHLIKAPADGTVTDIFFAAGDSVAQGAKLLGFDAT